MAFSAGVIAALEKGSIAYVKRFDETGHMYDDKVLPFVVAYYSPAKIRRAPSQLCRDARSMVIYDYGMRDYEYPPLPPN